MKNLIFLSSLLVVSSVSWAHRDSDIDNSKECSWNQAALEGGSLEVSCNDLYHLYKPKKAVKIKKGASFKFGAFNTLGLGSGAGRFKNYKLNANILKNYDLVAVSEVQPSTGEEFDSNSNLSKNPDLNFSKHYHKPGYLKLLDELRKSNSSWSLILSPVGQSQTEELLGFYFRSDRVKLENSSYCKAYNKKLKSKRSLVFAGGYLGPKFERSVKVPHLNKSYGCLMDLEAGENDIFRVPFAARFKVSSGFDFQFMSYHARFAAPILVSGGCGFECLEKVNHFLNTTFHKEGAFLGTLDNKALKFLKSHLDYLSLKKEPKAALFENYGPVIKFKYSKPRVYEDLLVVRDKLKKGLAKSLKAVWQDSYKNEIKVSDRDKILKFMTSLFEDSEKYEKFDEFINSKDRIYKTFLSDIVNAGIFGIIQKRYDIWMAPEKISRFYELSLVLEEMEKIAKLEKDKDVVLGGDLNLEDDADPYFWSFLKDNYKYSTVAIGSPTSLSNQNGLSKAYDHFMYDDRNSLEECLPVEASVLDFVNDRSKHWKGFEHYFVKSEAQIKKLGKIEFKKFASLEFVDSKGKLLSADQITSRKTVENCWTNKTEKGLSLADFWRLRFECRVLNQFIEGPAFFRLYTELISDHLPVGMKCNKPRDID